MKQCCLGRPLNKNRGNLLHCVAVCGTVLPRLSLYGFLGGGEGVWFLAHPWHHVGKNSIEPHHVGPNQRALRMNGPASQDYGFSHPQLLHLLYETLLFIKFLLQLLSCDPLGWLSLRLWRCTSGHLQMQITTFACNINCQLYHYIHTGNSCYPHGTCFNGNTTHEWLFFLLPSFLQPI